MKKAVILIILMSIILVIFGACELVPSEAPPHNNEDDPAYFPPDAVAIESLTLEIESITLHPNGTRQLTVAIMPEYAYSDYIVWSSNDESVAAVTQDGLVTADGVGIAEITVATKDGKISTFCTVMVVINIYTVAYDANGALSGTTPASQTQEENTTITVQPNINELKNIPTAGTAEAFKFGGWNTEPDGSGTTYAAGIDQFTLTENITLYANWVAFEVQDQGPAGGWIFYDKESFTDNWRYLEAAPADQEISEWGQDLDENGDDSLAVPELTGLGDGKTNSQYIYNTYSSSLSNYEAFYQCYNYTVAGFSDWFLPSKDELASMYDNLHNQIPLDNDFRDNFYWSSSENDTGTAHSHHMNDGYTQTANKSSNGDVRAARAF